MTGASGSASGPPAPQVLTAWNARDLQTSRVTPAGAHAAVILWGDDLDPDGGPSQSLARHLARVLTGLGEVCFRHAGDVPPRARALGTVSASRLPWRRGWTVIGCRDPVLAGSLFDAAFSQGDQTALIGAASDDRVLQVLGLTDLAGLKLCEGEVLVSAIVDGAGLLICAPDAGRLEQVVVAVQKPSSTVDVES